MPSPIHRVKHFKDLTLKYDSVSTLTVTIKSDVPINGPETVTRTLTFPATNGIETLTLPLDVPTPLEATIVRFRASSSGRVVLYGGVVRFKVIAEWFNGANGEVWETEPLGLGV